MGVALALHNDERGIARVDKAPFLFVVSDRVITINSPWILRDGPDAVASFLSNVASQTNMLRYLFSCRINRKLSTPC